MNRIWMELDGEALRNNIRNYEAKLPETCKVMAVVKADAYGHGAVNVSLFLQEMGIDFFAVAALSEAIQIRRAGIRQEILVLGYTDPSQLHDVAEYDLTQTITSAEHGAMIAEWCRDHNTPVKCHISVDSGMHRIGVEADDIEAIEALYESKDLNVTGIYSHLCVGDTDEEESVAFSEMQADVFDRVIDRLRSDRIDPGTIHLLSSYPAINYPDRNYDYARLGILMFGTLSSDQDYLRDDLGLIPVMQMKTHVSSVRWIQPGETVSYGRTFKAEQPTKIASLAVGYADGFPRSLSGGELTAIIGGKLVHGAGRICMDQLMVDVTDVESVKTGDVAILIGSDNGVSIRVEDIAAKLGSISNEFLSRLGSRIEDRNRNLLDLI